MIDLLRKILLKFGVDGAIFYTSLARTIQAFTGVVTIFFVAHFLTGMEQGFYYTFGSILAIQVFFELGLNGIITQYVAHEVSYLKWDSEIVLSGPKINLSRLASILHMTIRWYMVIACILFIILVVTGLFFFNHYDTSGGFVIWVLPWFLVSLSTTVAFLLNPILAFMEGLGKVKEVAKLRLTQQLITTFVIWASLLSGAKLFASGLGNLIGLLIMMSILIFNRYRGMLINIWKNLGAERVNYKSEIFPYQWKIALSWISGYFISQLFNPVLFATEGPVVAGQMGMTLAVLSGVFSLSFSWMSTKVPRYSGLIAQKKYNELDFLFDRTLRESVLINGMGLIVLFIIVYFFRHYEMTLGNRFLPYLPLLLMSVPIFINQIVCSWALYLRCHKEEPFLVQSLVSAILTSLSTVLLGKYFGVMGITAGYCFLSIFTGLLWGYILFRTKKRSWHDSL